MRLPTLRPWPPVLPAGEDTYQEFIAGTIPVKRVDTDSNEVLVIVEHEWGILRAFDEYLDAIREREGPPEVVDYAVTWTGMTGGETRPTVIRLELRIGGLRARPRLLFHDVAMTPLWMLTQHAMLGLIVDRSGVNLASPLKGLWLLGPTPVPGGLRRVLTQAGVPRPLPLARPPSRRLADSGPAAGHAELGVARGAGSFRSLPPSSRPRPLSPGGTHFFAIGGDPARRVGTGARAA